MTRFLDGLIGALVLVLLGVLSTGGWTVPMGPFPIPVRRAEDVVLAILPFLAFRCWLRPPTLPNIRPEGAVAAGVAIYTLVFSFITLTRHHTFQTHGMDLGYYAQEVWLMSRGLYPVVSVWAEIHAWGGHLDPIVPLLVPLAWIAPLADALLVAQTLFLALGAAPLYLLGRARVGPGPAAALALVYLLNPSLHGINVRDFHAAALAIPLLLTAMYAVESRSAWLFWIAAVLALGTREDAAIPVVGLGLWLALAKRRWVWGGAVVAGGLVWLVAAIHWLMPHFSGTPYPYLTARYGHLGGSLGEIVLSPVLRPATVIGVLASAGRVSYLAAILAPLAFLPLFAPLASVGAVTALAQNLVNSDPVLFNYRTQYQSFVLPFLLVGAVGGLQRLQRQPRAPSVRAVLAFAAFASVALGARTANDLAVPRWWPGAREHAARQILAQIPPDASVSAWDRFTPHLAERTRVFIFPLGADRSDYLALERGALTQGYKHDLSVARDGETVTIAFGGRTTQRFGVVAEAGDFLLLRKMPAGS